MVTGHQTILVHHQTGIAAITATALGYQVSHLSAAKVPSPVSAYSTNKAYQNVKVMPFSYVQLSSNVVSPLFAKPTLFLELDEIMSI